MPADDINLHFTGDIHAITTAHNLLVGDRRQRVPLRRRRSATRARSIRARSRWGRALDMNDRFLRTCVVGPRRQGRRRAARGALRHHRGERGHGDRRARDEPRGSRGAPRAHRRRARRTTGTPITAGDVGAAGAMTALLRDALKPNLVQTAEGGPAIVHCGPVRQHRARLQLRPRDAPRACALGDYAITEAGFGFDLGGEKFLDIKCRQTGVWPRARRARRDAARAQDARRRAGEDVRRARTPRRSSKGIEHLEKHLETARAFGLPAVVAINVFPNDTEDEIAIVEKAVAARGARLARCEGFAQGGEGALELARAVAEVVDATDAAPPAAAATSTSSTSRRRRRSARSRARSTARRTSPSRRRAEKQLERIARARLARRCRSAWRRRSSRSPTIRRSPAARATSRSPCARCASRAGAGFLVAAHRRDDDDARPARGARRAAGSSSSPNGKIRA